MASPHNETGGETRRSQFPKAYDPTCPEVRERRRRLHEAIAKNRTPETDAAMNKIAERFLARFHHQ
jgi:hypothetical protein